ncbi:hypothetical protein VM1G_11088 [Cytospora mali]|uniref:Microsomal glutathione S-transferase 3 n=1 Tax=Cytospora mali TaxID=578113 RepID=A0A194VJF6_CYTMA|nr:hypothetical protein VM1G_11088 [Valsa mali]
MPNYTLLAIPAMWLTTLAPHVYAIGYIKKNNNGRFDNANSKGHAWNAKLQSTVPADVLARYERALAAHRNGLENLPLFAAGVLAAKWAGVDVSWSVWTYIGLRVAYNFIYINVSTLKNSYTRTGIWSAFKAT